jgi:hypothetical protein
MDDLKKKILYTGAGASSGLAGLGLFSNCGGPACASCFGCGGIGIGILLIILFNKIMERIKGQRG